MINDCAFNIDNYHKEFNKYPKCLMESDGRVYGIFMIGNYYKRTEGYWGEYPPSYLKRIKALFPNMAPALHVFGGTVKPEKDEYTIDINPDLRPTVCGNAEQVGELFKKDTFEIVFADPPYSQEDAKKYGYKMPNTRLVIKSIRKIVKPGGILVWLDTKVPIYSKKEWTMVGMIGLYMGTNRRFRVIAIFQTSEAE